MKTPEDFKKFCNSTLKNQLDEVEEVRQKLRTKIIRMALLGGGGLFLALTFLGFLGQKKIVNTDTIMILMAVIFITGVLLLLYLVKKSRGSMKEYRPAYQAIISSIVKFVDPDLKYEGDKLIPPEETRFQEMYKPVAGDVPLLQNYYRGEHLITGQIEGVKVKSCQMQAVLRNPESPLEEGHGKFWKRNITSMSEVPKIHGIDKGGGEAGEASSDFVVQVESISPLRA